MGSLQAYMFKVAFPGTRRLAAERTKYGVPEFAMAYLTKRKGIHKSL